jgi:hypothetical protein
MLRATFFSERPIDRGERASTTERRRTTPRELNLHISRHASLLLGGRLSLRPVLGAAVSLLSHRTRRDGLFDLLLDDYHIETSTGLHRWKIDERLRRFPHDLLDENKAPALVFGRLTAPA